MAKIRRFNNFNTSTEVVNMHTKSNKFLTGIIVVLCIVLILAGSFIGGLHAERAELLRDLKETSRLLDRASASQQDYNLLFKEYSTVLRTSKNTEGGN